MKKIVLIGFLSGLCLNVFSQGIDVFEDLEESYESLKSTEEKLDFIFDKILNKQISDYIEMEKEKTKWHEKYKEIKEESSNKKLKDLELEKINLVSEISSLSITINNQNQEITELDRNKTKNLEIQRIEKNRVEAEIKEIFNHTELISEDLLKITKERALVYQLDQQVISDLNSYIDVSKKIIQAQNLLTKKINQLEVERQVNALKSIRNNKFDFLNIKINSLIILLEDEYCNKSQDLFEMFETVDSYGLSEEELKYELKKQRSLFISFPFLFDEITKKIKNINYKSPLQECY
jgi:hypothetical protein